MGLISSDISRLWQSLPGRVKAGRRGHFQPIRNRPKGGGDRIAVEQAVAADERYARPLDRRSVPRHRGLRPRLLAAVVRSNATWAFAAERQVVSQTSPSTSHERSTGSHRQYDPSRIEKFEVERVFLEPLLAPWRKGPIEHVGSTAVVGLCAKPVIDVMVGVTSLSESEPAIGTLARAGYQYAKYKADVMHWFCKPSFEMRTHHLHLIPHESLLWHERLRFRDLLRADPALAESFATLKLELARRFEFDREGYTDAKYPFILRALGFSRKLEPAG